MMANCFDVVTIGTDDKRPIVVRVILRTKTRCAIVYATCLKSGAIELSDLFATLSAEC